MQCSKSILGVFIFNVLYLLPAIWFSQSRANHEFVIYIGVVVIALVVVAYLNKRFKVGIPVLWLMSVWGFLHMSGGLVFIPDAWPRGAEKPVLYNLWLINGVFKFDQFVHMYGFGTVTWLIWQVLSQVLKEASKKNVYPTLGLLCLCVLASMGLGALNEVIEFAATLVVPETNVGGYFNTGWDLVCNTIGAVLAAILIFYASRSYEVYGKDKNE